MLLRHRHLVTNLYIIKELPKRLVTIEGTTNYLYNLYLNGFLVYFSTMPELNKKNTQLVNALTSKS